MGNQMSLCLSDEYQERVEAWAEQWHNRPGQIGRVLCEERISCAGWEIYDQKMLGRIQVITALDDDGLQKLDSWLGQFVAENGGYTARKLDNRRLKAPARKLDNRRLKAPARKRNNVR